MENARHHYQPDHLTADYPCEDGKERHASAGKGKEDLENTILILTRN
jgi:hypothetical protein